MTPTLRRWAPVHLLIPALVALLACGSPSSTAPNSSASQGQTAVPATVPSDATPQQPATIQIHEVPASVTELLQDYRTDGEEIVFSAGPLNDPAMTAPDLYRYNRESGERELIFDNPNRDSYLLPVAVSDGQYAFAELNSRLYGADGWGLWYLSSDAATPRMLDHSDRDQEMASPIPLMTLSGNRLVWQAFHQTSTGLRSELLLAALPEGDKQVLFSARPDTEAQYWTPSLDGDRLVYSVVDYAQANTPRYVYLLDLSAPTTAPRRLDTSGRAVTPAIHADNVVWKEADDVFDWGTITHLSLTDGRMSHLNFGRQTLLNYPSVGGRFVAAWGRDYGVIYVYDLVKHAAVLVEEWPQSPPAISVRPLIGGDLLLWVSSIEPDDSLHLKWSELPPVS